MKKLYLKLAGLGGVLAGLLGLAGKVGAYNLVEVNATSVDYVLAYVSELFTDLSVFVWLAIGIPLGFWVISKVIGLIRGRTR
ncbi:unnamed protein product [marine sediment metagenome]|uniref:Uncharacterized protein n=1 Tax=marine sediment metagenome TaxID=412755 RepID=X1KRE6_9ZZZZ